jgi:hypothetical protein
MKRLLAAAAVFALVVLTSACRVEVGIDVQVDESGTSVVTVTAEADADLLAASPRLLDDLRFDDLVAVGWQVEGPERTPDGGAVVVLRREASDLDELAAVLGDVGAPLRDVAVARVDEFARSTWELTGTSAVADGTAGLIDPEALGALGEAPFATDLADAGVSLADVVTMSLRVRLPGELTRTTGDATDGVITWQLPVDGTQVSLQAFSERTDRTASVARTTADVARFVLVVWVMVGVTFVVWVILARQRRRRARIRRATPPA